MCQPPPPPPQGCIGRDGASQGALEAVRQAVEGGCQSGWVRSLSVTNAIEHGTCRQGQSGWATGWALWRGRGPSPPFLMHPFPPPPHTQHPLQAHAQGDLSNPTPQALRARVPNPRSRAAGSLTGLSPPTTAVSGRSSPAGQGPAYAGLGRGKNSPSSLTKSSPGRKSKPSSMSNSPGSPGKRASTSPRGSPRGYRTAQWTVPPPRTYHTVPPAANLPVQDGVCPCSADRGRDVDVSGTPHHRSKGKGHVHMAPVGPTASPAGPAASFDQAPGAPPTVGAVGLWVVVKGPPLSERARYAIHCVFALIRRIRPVDRVHRGSALCAGCARERGTVTRGREACPLNCPSPKGGAGPVTSRIRAWEFARVSRPAGIG